MARVAPGTRVLLCMVSVVSCANGSAGRSEPSSATVATTAESTVATTEGAATTVRDDHASTVMVTEFDGASDIEPIDMALDPTTGTTSGRAAFPELPAAVSERWSATADRHTSNDMFRVGDIFVQWRQSDDGSHSLVGRTIISGQVLWTFEEPGWDFITVAITGDVALINAAGEGEQTVLVVDALDGSLLRQDTTDEAGWPFGVGRLARSIDGDDNDLEIVDARTEEVLAVLSPVGFGAGSVLNRTPDGIERLSFDSLQRIGDVIPIVAPSGRPRAVVASNDRWLFWLDDDVVDVFGLDGALVASMPGQDADSVEALASADVVLLSTFDDTIALAVGETNPVWSRPGFVSVLGSYGHRPFGTVEIDQATEVLALDTGETRCSLPVGRYQRTRNGFFDGRTAFDFQCAPIWRLELDDDVTTHLVDGGVVSVEQSGDESVIRFFG